MAWFRFTGFFRFLFSYDPVETYFNQYATQFDKRALQYERTIEILTLTLKEKDSKYQDLQEEFIRTLLALNSKPEEESSPSFNYNLLKSRKSRFDARREKLEAAARIPNKVDLKEAINKAEEEIFAGTSLAEVEAGYEQVD